MSTKELESQDNQHTESVPLEEKAVLHLLDRFREKIYLQMDKDGLDRIKWMALENLRGKKHLDHRLAEIPFHALSDKAGLTRVADRVSKTIKEVIASEDKSVSQKLLDKIPDLLRSRIVDEIRHNYRVVLTRFNIFEAFYPTDSRLLKALDIETPPRFTLADALRKAKKILQEKGEAFEATLPKEMLKHFPDLIALIKTGTLISRDKIHVAIDERRKVPREIRRDFKKAYNLFNRDCQSVFLFESGVFPAPYREMPEEMRLMWQTYLAEAVKYFEDIPGELQQLEQELGITDVEPTDLKVKTELKTGSPIDLLQIMLENEDDMQTSFLAQDLLIMTFEKLIFRFHPIKSRMSDANSELTLNGVLAPIFEGDSAGISYAKKVKGRYTFTDEPPGKGMVAGHESTSMESASLASKAPENTYYVIDWRYLKAKGKQIMYTMNGVTKALKGHLVGRGEKEDIEIIAKMNGRYNTLDDITDEVRARIVFDFTTDEILHHIENGEDPKKLFDVLMMYAQDLGENTFYWDYKPGEDLKNLAPGEFTIENKLNGSAANSYSSSLWHDFKIIGVNDEGVVMEIQFLPKDVYCSDIDPHSPASHKGSYGKKRKLGYKKRRLPLIAFPGMHNRMTRIQNAFSNQKTHKPPSFVDRILGK